MPDTVGGYYVISKKDQEMTLQFLTRGELLTKLKNKAFGLDPRFLSGLLSCMHTRDATLDLSKFPSESVLIIKGQAVKPQEARIVVDWSIE